MIAGMRVLAVIPARGGSKGLPNKNRLPFAGKPLVAWTIAAAQKAACIDRVVVSTDDPAIAEIARTYDCPVPFMRPADLATDQATLEAVVLHAMDTVGDAFDAVVLLQPTSPLRTAADIDSCVGTWLRSNAPVCVAVSPAMQSPFKMFTVGTDGQLEPLLTEGAASRRRQDFPAVYAEAGAIYVARTDWFRQHRRFISPDASAYVLDQERSIDIDTEWQFRAAEALVSVGEPAERNEADHERN